MNANCTTDELDDEPMDQVTAALQKGEGTAGQLLHDKQLYENMNATWPSCAS